MLSYVAGHETTNITYSAVARIRLEANGIGLVGLHTEALVAHCTGLRSVRARVDAE